VISECKYSLFSVEDCLIPSCVIPRYCLYNACLSSLRVSKNRSACVPVVNFGLNRPACSSSKFARTDQKEPRRRWFAPEFILGYQMRAPSGASICSHILSPEPFFSPMTFTFASVSVCNSCCGVAPSDLDRHRVHSPCEEVQIVYSIKMRHLSSRLRVGSTASRVCFSARNIRKNIEWKLL